MIHKITLPKLADRMQSATVAGWHVSVGDYIEKGQPLLDITTDKVTIEVESPASGTLRHILAVDGITIPVGAVIAIAANTDEELPEELLVPPKPCGLQDYQESCPLPQADEPFNPMRNTIAKRMTYSKTTAPHFYLTTVIDMSECEKMRQELKRSKVRASYNDMLIRASGMALAKYPRVATLYTPAGYVNRHDLNVGFAVAIGTEGLVVPVMENVDQKPLDQVAAETKPLIKKAKDKKLTPDDYGHGVFTVSNLGTFAVDEFTAIINPGESAILSVGKIEKTPVVRDDEIVIRPLMKVTLSSDHRVVDGLLAAKFNAYLKELMEEPRRLL